jgi:two-component system chemotaxis response regulator CheB
MRTPFPFTPRNPPRAVLLGGSAGASQPLREILSGLGPAFPAPVVVVQHIHEKAGGMLAANLDESLALPALEVLDKMPARPGHVYVAPPDYHLLVERRGTFALSVEEPVRWSRPSIDVFFQRAAQVWGRELVAILLSGANEDGAQGLAAVEQVGGTVIVQAPHTAQFPQMPMAALELGVGAAALTPEHIGTLLAGLQEGEEHV